ncbi:MAG TPA: hypothetical protein VKU79_06320 [Thermoplasmataceae archaeon]|nr:hypothetical protein [Thermoplasmatales archaeon AK]HLH86458.1 hypothetical protein [Thermoplasmataceae archaeon]
MDINLWNPQNVGFALALLTSYLLGIVHGITPDEHTWPITFSYSVGSYSTKGGFRAGAMFSAGFTIQRALLSELAYFALAGIFMTSLAFGVTYIAVGAAMAGAGVYIGRSGRYAHFHGLERALARLTGLHAHEEEQANEELKHTANPVLHDLKPVPMKLALLHGLIAGFGFGAFALIIYTVLSPSMPSPYLGFLPGLLFGLGTMTMQILFGMGFGKWMQTHKNLTRDGISFVAKNISRYVLTYGGYAFVVAGAAILAFPGLLNIGINTGIHIHNLDNLGIGFFLVIFAVVFIGVFAYLKSVRSAQEIFSSGSKESESESSPLK